MRGFRVSLDRSGIKENVIRSLKYLKSYETRFIVFWLLFCFSFFCFVFCFALRTGSAAYVEVRTKSF